MTSPSGLSTYVDRATLTRQRDRARNRFLLYRIGEQTRALRSLGGGISEALLQPRATAQVMAQVSAALSTWFDVTPEDWQEFMLAGDLGPVPRSDFDADDGEDADDQDDDGDDVSPQTVDCAPHLRLCRPRPPFPGGHADHLAHRSGGAAHRRSSCRDRSGTSF